VGDCIPTFSRGNSVWGACSFSSEEKYERILRVLLTIIPLLQDLTRLGGRFKDMCYIHLNCRPETQKRQASGFSKVVGLKECSLQSVLCMVPQG
jgi:hypothetical protein